MGGGGGGHEEYSASAGHERLPFRPRLDTSNLYRMIRDVILFKVRHPHTMERGKGAPELNVPDFSTIQPNLCYPILTSSNTLVVRYAGGKSHDSSSNGVVRRVTIEGVRGYA